MLEEVTDLCWVDGLVWGFYAGGGGLEGEGSKVLMRGSFLGPPLPLTRASWGEEVEKGLVWCARVDVVGLRRRDGRIDVVVLRRQRREERLFMLVVRLWQMIDCIGDMCELCRGGCNNACEATLNNNWSSCSIRHRNFHL